MSSYFLDNPIAFAQLRIRGGRKTTLLLCLGYAVIISLVVALTYEVDTRPASRIDSMMAWSYGLLGLQGLFLAVLAPLRVRSAISRDLRIQLMESHRMMPLMPRHAIVGYMLGAMSQFLLLGFVGFLIGCATSSLAGIPFHEWFFANLVLLVFSFLIASINAVTAFVAHYFFWILVGIGFLFMTSQGMFFLWAPALLLLVTPFVGLFTMFANGAMKQEAITGIEIGVCAQLVIILICIWGAARKYDRNDLVAFPPISTLGLLAIWVGLSLFGEVHLQTILAVRWYDFDEMEKPIAIGSIASSMLLATSVMASLVWTKYSDTQQGRHRRGGAQVFIASLLTATALVASMVSVTMKHATRADHSAVACVTALVLLQAYILMRIFFGWIRWSILVVCLFFALTWLGPLIADVIYYQTVSPDKTPDMDHFTRLSPLGFLIQLHTKPHPDLWSAAIVQFIVLVLYMALGQLRRKKLAAKWAKAARATPPPLRVIGAAASSTTPVA